MATDLTQEFCALRDTYIEKQFGRLNDMQRQAVFTTDGPLLILAGAGSGKTTVLVNRIANLIRFGSAHGSRQTPRPATEDDVKALRNAIMTGTAAPGWLDGMLRQNAVRSWNVMAITFTNKAAGELKERLRRMLGGEEGDEVFASTFHSACVRILRRWAEEIGYPRSFTIYDTDDSQRVMKAVYKELSIDDKFFPIKSAINQMSRWKDQLVSPEQALADHARDVKSTQTARIYAAYEKKLKETGAFDFDDLIYQTVQLLAEHPDVREFYQNKYRYLLVDEYQDTSVAQFRLVSLLTGPERNICVVGDDDQSIYRFRGATIENILNFEKQYRGARVIRLEQNYRSTQAILTAANAVIAHNLGRKGKKLWTANAQGDPVLVYEASDEGSEGNFVAGQILAGSRGKNFKDYAILYRTNAQSNAMEFALKRNGIPYRVIGGTRFFDRAEVKDMLSYLCVINNRADDLRLGRIINNPPRGLGAKTIETARRLAEAEGKPLYSVISDPYSYAPLEKSAMKMMQFSALIEGMAQLLEDGMSLPDFYDELLIRTGYVDMLESKDTEENKTRLENVRELKSSINSYVENAETPTLAGFLEEIALYTDLEQYNENDDAVVMMTMHSAKGLEFPHVFLVGFEDGLFPGMRAIGDAEEMEEERRLCYVAITRAKQHLVITYARQRMLYGRTTTNLPSRFVDELPAESVKRIGAPKPSYQQTEPRQYGSFGRVSIYGDSYNDFSQIPTRPKPQKDYSVHTAPKSAPKVSFAAGEMVQHKAFGRGMILTVLTMGNDALLEIAFDGVGTKRLMANTAAQHMKKL